jgi:methionine-rich copper-binding protein CopC
MIAAETAWGATTLVSSVPADTSVVTVMPQQIVLTFSEQPLTVGDAVSIFDPRGVSIGRESPTIAGTRLTENLPPLALNGLYKVAWRILDNNRKVVSGQFTFTLNLPGLPSASPAPKASSNTTMTRLAWILGGSAIVILLVVVVTTFVGRKSKDAELTDEPPDDHRSAQS